MLIFRGIIHQILQEFRKNPDLFEMFQSSIAATGTIPMTASTTDVSGVIRWEMEKNTYPEDPWDWELYLQE